MTYLTSEEEYTFKVTLVFWKFYELGVYFELPDVRRYIEQERSLNTINTKSSAIENKFLAILNYLALFELATLVISLALGDLTQDFPYIGIIQIVVALSIVLIAIILLRIQEKKL
jgi:hypothetical protein